MHVISKQNEYLQNIYQVRAQNLSEYSYKIGGDNALCKKLGISHARLHVILRKKNAPFTEKMARSIEQRLQLPLGSLDIATDQYNKSKLPVYLLEDLRDLSRATPSTYLSYDYENKNSYFITIINKIYEPHIQMGSKILVNPDHKKLKNGKLFIVGYDMAGLLNPVIRTHINGMLVDIVSKEPDTLEQYKIYGACEAIISTLTFG